MNIKHYPNRRKRVQAKIRSKISGTLDRPRLSVFRSTKHIYAQIIDDEKGSTLVESWGEDALVVGREIVKRALAKKIKQVVFDRGGFIYTGKIKAFADGAREGGLKF